MPTKVVAGFEQRELDLAPQCMGCSQAGNARTHNGNFDRHALSFQLISPILYQLV
jgi:hypothetical protein